MSWQYKTIPWPDGLGEEVLVCRVCREQPRGVCRKNKKIFAYCLNCKRRLTCSWLTKKSILRITGASMEDVVEIATNNPFYMTMRERGPNWNTPPPEIQALKDMPYSEYLKTDHWRRTRERALKRGGYRCAECGRTNSLTVHHLSYDRIGHEYDDDLQVLCWQCHNAVHEYDHQERRDMGYTTTALGLPLYH